MENEITVNGVEYVKKSTLLDEKEKKSSNYVLVRGDRSGLQFGILKSRNGTHVVLNNAKRIFCWSGACSISQIVVDGVDENNSKISISVDSVDILDAIEILPISEKALNSLNKKIWKK